MSVPADDGLALYVGDLHCHDLLSEAEGYPARAARPGSCARTGAV